MHLPIKFILYFTFYVHQIDIITARGRGGGGFGGGSRGGSSRGSISRGSSYRGSSYRGLGVGIAGALGGTSILEKSDVNGLEDYKSLQLNKLNSRFFDFAWRTYFVWIFTTFKVRDTSETIAHYNFT